MDWPWHALLEVVIFDLGTIAHHESGQHDDAQLEILDRKGRDGLSPGVDLGAARLEQLVAKSSLELPTQAPIVGTLHVVGTEIGHHFVLLEIEADNPMRSVRDGLDDEMGELSLRILCNLLAQDHGSVHSLVMVEESCGDIQLISNGCHFQNAR